MSARREHKREMEKRSFQLILEAGEEGILQSDMWKRLESNSQMGTIIALNLLKRGFIERRKELHEGRWTYRIISLRKPVTVDSIIDCPCTACNDINRCTPGCLVSPLLCVKLNYWLDINTGAELVSLEELDEDNK